MMEIIDSNTRFYIDIDIKAKKILNWNYGQREKLEQELANSNHRRIFITKGQYNKLDKEK
ncbi:MAG: hypothetical protein PHZ07_00660 [Patescibacteria group bacterium]|nr:hypothetical protein [Patescibacteria group bacterium]MDD4304780.1 hypothetical protein [Patescibacteria group bacterium]MDD4695265.1 hypothetical protein [Patescibacteria group bacterium]